MKSFILGEKLHENELNIFDRYLGANKYLINLVDNFLTNVPKSRKNILIKINIMLTL